MRNTGGTRRLVNELLTSLPIISSRSICHVPNDFIFQQKSSGKRVAHGTPCAVPSQPPGRYLPWGRYRSANPLFPRFHGGPYASSYNPIYPEKDNLTSLWYFLLRFIPRSLPGNMMLPPCLSRPYWRIIIDLALSCDFRENRSSKLLNGYSIRLYLSFPVRFYPRIGARDNFWPWSLNLRFVSVLVSRRRFVTRHAQTTPLLFLRSREFMQNERRVQSLYPEKEKFWKN